MAYRSDVNLFPIWREPRSFWERSGLSRRQQRVLDVCLVLLLLLFTAGWVYSAAEAIGRGEAPMVARSVGTSVSPLARPDATFALNALLEQFIDWEDVRGASGSLQVVFKELGDTLRLPNAVPPEAAIAYVPAGAPAVDTVAAIAKRARPQSPGIWNLLVGVEGAIREVPALSVVTLVPASELREGRIGDYRIGEWPQREGAYAAPRGFVRVTPENMTTPVSTHFEMKDFLTKGQEGVWPKYVVLSTRLLDKLELTLQELETMGHPVEDVFVVSGFRTPWYNEAGGNPQGRGAMSRHMYGDAADIAIDNDSDGCMDDLNGDGTVNVDDARVIVAAAERVEQKHPDLVGGIGLYRPSPGAHCGMVHIDARGHRARW